MKRLSGLGLLLVAAAGGCVGPDGAGASGVYMSQAFGGRPDGATCARAPMTAPGLVGPYGQAVAVTAPATRTDQNSGEALARAVIAQSLPPEIVQQIDHRPAASGGSGVVQAQFSCPPGGCPAPTPPGMAGGPGGLPLTLPGSIAPPGIPALPGGALPGIPGAPPAGIPGAVAATGAFGVPAAAPFGAQRTEIRFIDPKGMKISWFAPKADGKPGFGANFLDVPGRYNFLQAAVYRLKLSEIPGFPGLELYPTLEVVPANAKTATFLAHSAVPISFTLEDLDQVRAGNYVVKVIYLPDPQFQDLAATAPDEVVSSRLEPGVDPIAEAQRRGCILAVVRLGNIDLEAPNTPAMDAPGPCVTMPPAAMQGMAGMPGMMRGMPGMMLPGAGMANGRMGPFGAMNGRQPTMGNPMGMQLPPSMLPPSMPAPGVPAAPTVPANVGPAGPAS